VGSTATSAGLVLCRRRLDDVELLIVHPGGPFWANKDEGAWSIPKGVIEPGEEALEAARRETSEELGIARVEPPFVSLGEARMKSGKRVLAWAARAEVDERAIRSNEIDIEWPPRSGRTLRIPEIDRARWVHLEVARPLVNAAIVPLLERAASGDVVRALFASTVDQ
jgi:predicted NUDIX family NTP pyrophosphohydrolase